MDIKKFKSIIILLLLLTLKIEAHAAVIEVNSTGGGLGTNQLCSLRAAIRAAETDAPFSACAAGSGDDIIVLPDQSTIVLNQLDNNNLGGNALPLVKSKIVIEGNDAVIRISPTAPMMRFVSVTENSSSGDIGHLTLKNLTLKGGHVSGSGGAIHNQSILALELVRLEDNHATFEAGALTCVGSNAFCTVTSSAIISNSANYGGAIFIDLAANLTLDKSIVFGNQATIGNGAADGGSVYVNSGHAAIINSTIANNQANRYGGLLTGSGSIFIPPGTIALDYSTIFNNNPIGIVGNVEVKNSVLSANVGGNCRPVNSVVSNGYNHSDDDSCTLNFSGDVIDIPVNLAPLVQTNRYIQSYPLSYQSVAMDAADSVDCPNTDQRDVMRPLDGDNDGIAGCDKGAHERVNDFIFMNGFD